MLGALTQILLCQLAGEVIARTTGLPVPGPVIGMVILFCALLFAGKVPVEIDAVGGFLLRYLALLFVPAGVGVIVYLELLLKSWLPIAGAVVVGTMVTIAVAGVTMQFLNRRSAARRQGEIP